MFDTDIHILGLCVLIPLFLLLSIEPFSLAFWWYNRKTRSHNTNISHECGSCGYDLRGLDEDTRCPECGAVPQACRESPFSEMNASKESR